MKLPELVGLLYVSIGMGSENLENLAEGLKVGVTVWVAQPKSSLPSYSISNDTSLKMLP